MRKFGILMVFIGVILSGCNTMNSVPTDYAFDRSSDKGVLLASVTYSGTYSGYAIKFREVGDSQWRTLEIGSGTALLPPGMMDWDIEYHGLRGNVFAVELPSGEYEFASWKVASGVAVIDPINTFSIKFDVSSGVASYIGNFHFVKQSGFGATVTGVNVSFQNLYERDINSIQGKYKYLDLATVQNLSKGEERQTQLGSGNSTTIYLPLIVTY